MRYVLDASAVLALLNGEPGGDLVGDRLRDSCLSVVNAIEVGTRLVDAGMSPSAAREALSLLGLEMIPLDAGLASLAVELRPLTAAAGLSLADRACLATAIRHNATALTSDKAWSRVTPGCAVEQIR
jgi:PIN domain nuclease of toxin-antitoxin system